MDDNQIIREAVEYINNDLTQKETAAKLGISRRTLQIHLKKLGGIDSLLYNLVLVKEKNNVKKGRIKGGKIGKAKPRYTIDEANMIAKGMLEGSLTYEEASKKYGIPKSTIYDMVHSDYVSNDDKFMLDVLGISNNTNKNGMGR